MTITSNASQVIALQVKRLENLAQTDRMVRTAATTALGLMKYRIHEQGLDAREKPIGTYSKAYMVVRTGSYQNAGRISRGKNKGKLKNAGVFTDRVIQLNKNNGVFSGEEKVGTPRPQYHRSNDTKVILSLTRQMENDIKVVAVRPGVYGIGYSNAFNYNKSQWLEAMYKKKIFSLSPTEQKAVQEVAQKFADDALSR